MKIRYYLIKLIKNNILRIINFDIFKRGKMESIFYVLWVVQWVGVWGREIPAMGIFIFLKYIALGSILMFLMISMF